MQYHKLVVLRNSVGFGGVSGLVVLYVSKIFIVIAKVYILL
jgi:hypothetical protein